LEDKFNLNNVSLTGDDDNKQSNNLYTFEGQDYKSMKQQSGATGADQAGTGGVLDFIDIGVREKRQV